jgi:hypothetical protein
MYLFLLETTVSDTISIKRIVTDANLIIFQARYHVEPNNRWIHKSIFTVNIR